MDLLTTYGPLVEVLSTDLNTIQRRIMNFRNAVPGSDSIVPVSKRTTDPVYFQMGKSGTRVPANGESVIDNTVDWRNRLLLIVSSPLSATTDVIGGSAPQYVNSYLENPSNNSIMLFWTGTGAPTGAPTLNRASGDYYADDQVTIFQYFVSNADGALYVRNTTGADRGVLGIVFDIIGIAG